MSNAWPSESSAVCRVWSQEKEGGGGRPLSFFAGPKRSHSSYFPSSPFPVFLYCIASNFRWGNGLRRRSNSITWRQEKGATNINLAFAELYLQNSIRPIRNNAHIRRPPQEIPIHRSNGAWSGLIRSNIRKDPTFLASWVGGG